MTQEHIEWLDNHPHILGNTTVSKEQLIKLFEIYNAVTGETKRPTSCGRCLLNTKKTIKHYYDQNRSND